MIIEKKAAVILFVSNDCNECEEVEKVLHAVSKKSFSSKPYYYIMDAVMDEPPEPFGKQEVLPSLYFRGLISHEKEMKNRKQDLKPTAIRIRSNDQDGDLTNEGNVTNFVELKVEVILIKC